MAKRIVIFSTKGGVGKTLISSNIAVCLGQDYAKKVCLIDLDLQAVGDMARMSNLSPQKALVDLMNSLKKNPQETKREDYVTSTPFGFDFLPGVLKPRQAPHLDAAKIKDTLALLDKDYDYIIVDAGKSFSDIFLTVLNQANLIFLIATPDILSIFQTKWAIDTLQFLHFPLLMVKMILNRAESVSSISWQEIKINLPIDILASIPSDGKNVGLAVNRGIPIYVDTPRSKVSQAIKKMCERLASEEKLYIEHRGIEDLQIKDAALEKAGEIWDKKGMTESLSELPASFTEEKDELSVLKQKIHVRLIEELNLKRMDQKVFSDEHKAKELKDRAQVMITNFMAEEAGSFITSEEMRKKIVKEILDEALGLGALEDLMARPDITDIMVNNKDQIYIEEFGKIQLSDKHFISNDQVKTIIERIIAPIGRRIDESVPMVDARLPDGSRVNAIIPPLALTGPALTIRKFRKERYEVEELISMNTLNKTMSDFIRACVLCRKNMIVSGGTGSGKTTILNVLSSNIPPGERIITIEDAAELKLHQEHWVRLESRPPNIEGKGAITIRDLFRNTLRMRPDRIIIGECRGVESLDMLQAMNTGHDGSMTTIHANSTHDVLSRLDSMILMSGVELPVRAIREMIASAIDVIVHTARLSDGTRKIVAVTEIIGMTDETHIHLEDIFMFKQSGIDDKGNVLGNFTATGHVPSFLEEINIKGIPMSKDIFKPVV